MTRTLDSEVRIITVGLNPSRVEFPPDDACYRFPINPGSDRILCPELLCRLPFARRLERLVMFLWLDQEIMWARRLDAALPHGQTLQSACATLRW